MFKDIVIYQMCHMLASYHIFKFNIDTQLCLLYRYESLIREY